MSHAHSSDGSSLPVPYKPDPTKPADSTYHTKEWTSGKQGGGSVPADLEWRTNPKQWQEESGAGLPETAPDVPGSKP